MDYKNVKENRTSQLRAIYWADKTAIKPPLWKMSRFTNIPKHIDSNNINKHPHNVVNDKEISLHL